MLVKLSILSARRSRTVPLFMRIRGAPIAPSRVGMSVCVSSKILPRFAFDFHLIRDYFTAESERRPTPSQASEPNDFSRIVRVRNERDRSNGDRSRIKLERTTLLRTACEFVSENLQTRSVKGHSMQRKRSRTHQIRRSCRDRRKATSTRP